MAVLIYTEYDWWKNLLSKTEHCNYDKQNFMSLLIK